MNALVSDLLCAGAVVLYICQDDIIYFERLFMPAGSYELLPDDNLAPPTDTNTSEALVVQK